MGGEHEDDNITNGTSLISEDKSLNPESSSNTVEGPPTLISNVDQIIDKDQMQNQPSITQTVQPINSSIGRVTSPNRHLQKISKRILKIIIIIAIIVFVSTITIIAINIYRNNSSVRPQDNSSTDETEASGYSLLSKDFQDEIISTDKYIQQLLYLQYDNNSLDEKYIPKLRQGTSYNVDREVETYYKDISEATLLYYFDKITLSNLTFIDGLQNESSQQSNSLIDYLSVKASASEKPIINLDKATLSPNGQFIVWYTDSGDSAISLDDANKIAVGLDKSVSSYEKELSADYEFDSEMVIKSAEHNDKLKILRDNGIDEDKLINAMQIFIYSDKDDSALASYTSLEDSGLIGLLNQYYSKITGSGINGNTTYPFMVIKTESLSDIERLEQIYNHELFHHFQYHLCSASSCDRPENFISEATANWASSIISNKTTGLGFLNEWAEVALRNSNSLMGSYLKKNGKTTTGYASFVYLYAYDQTVDDGRSKIISSLYEKNSLAYLGEKAELDDLNATIEYQSFMNLSQGYLNKNILATQQFDMPNAYNNIKLKGLISSVSSNQAVIINNIGIDYYLIEAGSDKPYKAIFNSNDVTENLQVIIVTEKDGLFSKLDSQIIHNAESTIDTNNYGEYDRIYIIVANSNTNNKYTYNIRFEETEKITPEIARPLVEINPPEFITDFNNYKISMTSRLVTSTNGMDVTTDITSEGVMDELHQMQYLSMNASVMGMTVNTQSYIDYSKGITYMKQPFSDTWTKTNTGSSLINISNIISKFEDMSTITKIDDNKYRVIFSKDDVKNLLATASSSTIDGSVSAIVYLKDSRISKLEYDFSNLISFAKVFTITIDVFDYNNANDVIIPSGVVSV